MAKINAYLVFNGSCEEAFNLYRSVFGGEFLTFSRFRDMPPVEDYELPEQGKEKIMHVSLPISKETDTHGKRFEPGDGRCCYRAEYFPFGRNGDEGGSGSYLQRPLCRGQGNDANGRHFLGSLFWNAYRPVQQYLDGEFRLPQDG